MAEPNLEEVETLVGALIAQLLAKGLFNGKDLHDIAKRLDWAEMPDMADSVRSIPFLDRICRPEEVRAGFEVIDGGAVSLDGGNGAE